MPYICQVHNSDFVMNAKRLWRKVRQMINRVKRVPCYFGVHAREVRGTKEGCKHCWRMFHEE